MGPRSLSAVVARARQDGDWEHHLRDFLDAFYAADGDAAGQAAFIAEEPGLLGLPEADAFLGGVGEHLTRRWGLPIPAWVRAGSRYLTRALFVPDETALRGYLLCVSPVAFRTRLIFTGPDPLQRARFPYRRGVITMPPEHPPGALR